jgi:hypothetical protein
MAGTTLMTCYKFLLLIAPHSAAVDASLRRLRVPKTIHKKKSSKNKTFLPDADTKDRWSSLMRNLLEGIVGIFVGFLSAVPDLVVRSARGPSTCRWAEPFIIAAIFAVAMNGLRFLSVSRDKAEWCVSWQNITGRMTCGGATVPCPNIETTT